jgi:NAD(P)H-dependent flavin oxidoreductase YrpB (nitropropane dioxygenase family)
MISTRFTELVGSSVPIQQAPIGDVASSPALPIAVARAGGHGMLAAVSTPAHELEAALDEFAAANSRAWGVNVVLPLTSRESLELAAERAPLLDFHQGDPDRALVELAHRSGALASWQVGTAREARAAEEAGCDLIVAQGIEAAGFTRGRVGTLALLQEVLEAVSVPVLAAGGIGTARGVATALAAGAGGVRVGTRFVAAAEAGADPRYVEALAAAHAEDTVLSGRFAPPGVQIHARAVRAALETGEPFFAGESTGAVRGVQPAAAILRELADGAERLLVHASGLVVSAPVPAAT